MSIGSSSADPPRQFGHPFEIGANHARFRRGLRHPFQPAQFPPGLDSDLGRHAGLVEFALQIVEVRGGVVRLAELLLNRLQLFAQQELAVGAPPSPGGSAGRYRATG